MVVHGPTLGGSLVSLALWLLVCFGAAWVGDAVTRPALADWYAYLEKPWWTPANHVFGPVWAALYLLMAVAAWLVAIQDRTPASVPLVLFYVQLALNVGWSMLFFGLRSPGLGLIEIAVLWVAVLATIIAFSLCSALAAWLMIPYLAWVSFAAFLNYTIWHLNRAEAEG